MKKIALAGNPNVGKSTLFNQLTGMHQHTGNWPGKTVSNAVGSFSYHKENYLLYDLPGTYSLISHSEEETVARDFLCFQEYDMVIVVCDALCLERNLNLVLQILEINQQVIVCVNLLDEAKKKGIELDLELLSKRLGVPVVGTVARSKKGFFELLTEISRMDEVQQVSKVRYSKEIEDGILELEQLFQEYNIRNLNPRWLALKLIDYDPILLEEIDQYLGFSFSKINRFLEIKERVSASFSGVEIKDSMVSSIMKKAEEVCDGLILHQDNKKKRKSLRLDRLVTSRFTGILLMLFLFMLVFWLTIVGSNYPSSLLYDLLFSLEEPLYSFFQFLHFPDFLIQMLVLGMYRTLAWVVSVMLPPMAIFFPLFTLLEDSGYLPRVAFNLDKCFQKCKACGKQALSMCMGFGCNAAGVIGCRIIDSPRERLIAILTNNFVPCNGRFPMIMTIIAMFFVGFELQGFSSLIEVGFLTLVILLGIFMTFFISWLLSKTLLKGVPSSFTLELPPYRKPQFFKVIVRSIFDKTLHVLGRAVLVSIPAGIIIWLLANTMIDGNSLLHYISSFLDPFGELIGLDGVILTAFLLGFPANEIVIPLMIMAYMSLGNMVDFSNIQELKNLLVTHGWTALTALNTIIFSLMHFPCSTTCLTIRKETNSWKWTLIAFLIPTVCGIVLCLFTSTIWRIVQLFL